MQYVGKMWSLFYVGNIRTNLMERGQEDVAWIHLAQDRLQWRVLVKLVVTLLLLYHITRISCVGKRLSDSDGLGSPCS
jgi:hypothetical protein